MSFPLLWIQEELLIFRLFSYLLLLNEVAIPSSLQVEPKTRILFFFFQFIFSVFQIGLILYSSLNSRILSSVIYIVLLNLARDFYDYIFDCILQFYNFHVSFNIFRFLLRFFV